MAGHDEELLISDDLARDMLPYQRLLGDAIKGDSSLFGRQDTIEQQWRIVEPVLDLPNEPYFYESGSSGPKEADRLVGAVPGGWVKPTGFPRAA